MEDLFSIIPLDELFTAIELPEDKIPLRWWTMKTVAEYLEVSERTVKRYKAEGKLEYKYVMVKGHRKIYFTNHSVISLKNDKRWSKEYKEADPESFDTDYEDEDYTDEEVDKINEIRKLFSKFL